MYECLFEEDNQLKYYIISALGTFLQLNDIKKEELLSK